MQRRTVVVILALFAAAASLAQVTWYFESMPPPSGAWRSIALGLTGTALAAAIPTIGAVSLARRRETGVAVLVAAGLVTVPMIIVLPRILSSGGGSDLGRWLTWLNTVALVALVVAGVLAWTIRRAELWRRDRPVASPYVAVAAAALLFKELPRIIRSDGPLGIFMFDAFALMTLTTLVVVALILVMAARLPRRLAACLLLASFTPRLYFSIELAASPMGMGRATTPEATFAWLAMAGEATLVGLAIWWLVASRDHADGGPLPPPQVPAGTA